MIIIHGAMIRRGTLKEKGVKMWTGLIRTTAEYIEYMANRT